MKKSNLLKAVVINCPELLEVIHKYERGLLPVYKEGDLVSIEVFKDNLPKEMKFKGDKRYGYIQAVIEKVEPLNKNPYFVKGKWVQDSNFSSPLTPIVPIEPDSKIK